MSDLQSITIQGFEFIAPAPYAEGHPLTEKEAAVLNRTYAENLGNNFRKVVKAAKDAGTASLEALQDAFTTYAETYNFAVKRARIVLDPVKKEEHKLAKAKITERLREKNVDLKTVSAEQMSAWVEALCAKDPTIREEAERRIAAAKSIASDVLDDLGIGEDIE
jgi:hypothetical protein